jgi:hypothetical protein
MSSPLSDLALRWKKEPIRYHYRRYFVQKIAVNKADMSSHVLYSGGQVKLLQFINTNSAANTTSAG